MRPTSMRQTWITSGPVGSLTVTFRSSPNASLHRLNGQRVEIVVAVAFLLPAVGVQQLAEITLLIEQSDADERQVEIARRLQMIAGKNAQAAGINGQAFGEAVFGRKIGDELAARLSARPSCMCAS